MVDEVALLQFVLSVLGLLEQRTFHLLIVVVFAGAEVELLEYEGVVLAVLLLFEDRRI